MIICSNEIFCSFRKSWTETEFLTEGKLVKDPEKGLSDIEGLDIENSDECMISREIRLSE